MNDQDEMYEAGTETPAYAEATADKPAFLGCPQHMPTHLPGGFDGVEPAPKKRSDLEKMNDLLLERLRRIRRISDDAIMDVRTDEEHNKAFLAACTEIRKLVDFYKPREKPIDKTAQEMKTLSEIQREEARQKRKIHWTCYPTKVDLCAMGKTQQNGKVYEVRISKRGDSKVQDTYGQCKVNGKTVITCSFTGNAWMLKRILTEGMQALVNYKAKKARDSRRNYAKRDAAKAAKKGGAK